MKKIHNIFQNDKCNKGLIIWNVKTRLLFLQFLKVVTIIEMCDELRKPKVHT